MKPTTPPRSLGTMITKPLMRRLRLFEGRSIGWPPHCAGDPDASAESAILRWCLPAVSSISPVVRENTAVSKTPLIVAC